jgi:Spy/CpxP family protein refolding chaperone
MTSPVPVSATKLFLIVAAYSLLCGVLAQGQTPASKPGALPERPAQGPANRAPHQQPCWQQVGISKEAMGQRREVEQNTRAEVEAVCADTSLTSQQKHSKIKELRQQARQQIESIITPQQQEELKACNAERNAGHPSGGGPRPGGGGLGPCGEAEPAPAPGSSGGNTPAGNNADPKQR